MDHELRGQVAIITGASRGIGKAIALKFAEQGINIVVAAKSTEETEQKPGTIYQTVDEVEELGAGGLAVQTDVRFEEQIATLMEKSVDRFGRIDILVNNAGAIHWENSASIPPKRFHLMTDINYRAPFLLSRATIPYLKESPNPHIINMSPPLGQNTLVTATWKERTGYLMSKFGMTHLTMGLAEELAEAGVAVNSIWPANIIDTLATRVFASMFGIEEDTPWYSPDLMADACLEIIRMSAKDLTGQALIAEDLLLSHGIDEISTYQVESPLQK